MSKTEKTRHYDASLLWSCTEQCNLSCFYCFRNRRRDHFKHGKRAALKAVLLWVKKEGVQVLSRMAGGRPALPGSHCGPIDIKSLLETLGQTGKIFNIIFTGWGEPFLIPNIIETCQSLTRSHYIAVASNLTSRKCVEFCEKIDPERVIYIHASFHIPELTRRNLLKDYIEHYQLFKEKGFHIYAYIVGHPAFLKKIGEYKKLCKENGIELAVGHFIGRYKKRNLPFDYTPQEKKIFGFKKVDTYLDAYERKILCNAGYNIFVANASGQIHPCYLLPEAKGHIYKKLEFNNCLMRCPPDFCFNPLKFRDPYLFEKAKDDLKGNKN